MSRPTIQNGQEPLVAEKTVVFRPATTTDVLRGGYAVCYNQNSVKDWEGNTKTVNSFSRAEVAFADGSQDFNARFLEVEKPATANLPFFAGIVSDESDGAVNGDIITILVPVSTCVIPIYADVSVTLADAMYIHNGDYDVNITAASGVLIGAAVETVDRSGTAGKCWMRYRYPGITGANLADTAVATFNITIVNGIITAFTKNS